MNGSRYIAETLKKLGIKRVYLYPGGTIAPLLDDLVKCGIEFVCSISEQGAGYAAIGAAKINNEPQVVIVTSGPGATNLVTPIADAYYDSIPLIVFTGQVSTPDINWSKSKRQTGFQETDVVGITSSITKSSKILIKDSDLVKEVNDAYNLSLNGRFGPVLLDLPMDVQRTKPNTLQSKELIEVTNLKSDSNLQINKVIDLLSESKRPLVFAGNGVYLSGAIQELKTFIDNYNIPIVSSMPGTGVIDSDHPMYKGYIGHTGEFYSNIAVHHSDLLIVLGARLDVRQTGSEVETFLNKKIIHVDIDKAELKDPRVKTHLKIFADCKQFLNQMNKKNLNFHCTEWLSKISEWKSKFHSSQFYENKKLSSYHIISDVSNYLENKKVIVTSGVGTHQQLVGRYFNFSFPDKRWLTSAGHGTMGYDLPTAIGAVIESKDIDYGIVFVGDGSFQMNIQELTNVVNLQLPLKIFVLDNQRLGIVSQFQLMNWDTDLSTGNKNNPNFANIARAYEIESYEIDDKSQIDETLKNVFSNNKPCLVHCRINYDEDVLPMLLGGQKMNQMHPFKNEIPYEK
jgi:acetolactate synthase-1/2/3 large subunit